MKEKAYKHEDKLMFIIDKDHINDDEIAGNLYGDVDEKYEHLLTEKFRLYDDDNILYYEGRSTGQMTEKAFEILDWAMYDSGCTDLQFWYKNKWASL